MNVVGTNITSTTNDQVYFSTEKPTLNVEAALYTFSSSNSFLGRIEDYISNDTTKYYTCMNTTSSCSGFNAYVLYEYISTTNTSNVTTYKITKADRFTYEVNSVDSSSSGIYAISDLNDTTSYYYRGDIQNNSVKFGKDETGNDMYWQIVRINGNGSIRMIYTGTSTTVTELTCSVYSVKSYINPVQAKVRYHGYLSKDLDSIRDNTYDSNIKEEIDAWYEKHLLIIQPMAKIVTMYYIHHKLSILYSVTITVFIREM